MHRRCVGEQKCSGRACRCAGASKACGGEWVVRSAGVRRGCVGEQKCSARACRCAGASEGLRRGRCCAVGGEGIAQPAGMRRGCVGERKCSGGRVAVRGRAKVCGGVWVVRSAGLTHIRRSSTRARVLLLYIRPPCPRREIAAMGPKDAPASTHRPRRLPHPPRLRLHFRAGVHTSPAQPSTSPAQPSATPTKNSASRSNSYPQWVIHGKVIHIVARRPVQNVLALAPAHAYIYNISFARRPLPGSVRAAPEKSPRRCAPVSRAAVRRVGEGEGKGGRPLAQCRTMPLVCRIPVCNGGSAPGQPRPCPCALPAATCLRPRPRPLMGEAPCAGWGRAKAKADAPSRSAEPCRLCAESLCAKAEVHKAIPAPACLRPCSRPLMGEVPCAGWGRAKAKADAPSRSNPPPAAYRRAPAA